MSDPIYTQRQIMLCLAYSAYTDETLPQDPDPDPQIKKDLIKALSSGAATPLPPVQDDWIVVWGPVTSTIPGAEGQQNMVYVAQRVSNPAEYAVAVRGTNFTDLLDWLVDDLDIVTMIPWPGADDAMVSEATNIGLTAVLALSDPTETTLLSYLTSVMKGAGAATQICFTGHSLGATLASTLALHFRDVQSQWDPESLATVTTINFAGPSAGNTEFARHFDASFAYTGAPSVDWTLADSYADCVRTSLDVAPLAWNAADLKQIPKLYELGFLKVILPPLGTTEIIDGIVDATEANSYTQVSARQATLTGTFVQYRGSSAFLDEAAYQHHASYPLVLDVPALETPPSMFGTT